MVSEIFDSSKWKEVPGFDLQDLTYHRAKDQGTVRVAFDRKRPLAEGRRLGVLLGRRSAHPREGRLQVRNRVSG